MKRVNRSMNLFIGTTTSIALDVGILAKRKALYQTKINEHPERWSKDELDWQPIGAAALNPEQHKEAA
jgi:putative transposase